MVQAHLGLRLFLTTTRTPILSPAFRLIEMGKAARRSTTLEPLAVTTRRDQAQWAPLCPLMILGRMTGILTPGPGAPLREGEEGVAVEIDNLTGADGVVVKEHRSTHNKDSRSPNGVVPTITHPA